MVHRATRFLLMDLEAQTGKIQNYLFGLAAVALILIVVRLFRGF